MAPRIPKQNTRFINPQAESSRGRSALEAMRGYAGAPSQASVMHPGALSAYEGGELAGMAEMLIPGAAMAKGALGAALAGVIKPRGGNWIPGDVESSISNLLRPTPSPAYDMYGNEVANPLANSPMYRTNAALNRWIEGPLTKYIKRDLATPEDPVRKLADQGISHMGIPENLPPPHRTLADFREFRGYPREGLSLTPGGAKWENLSDSVIDVSSARQLQNPSSSWEREKARDNPWIEKLAPDDPVYNLGASSLDRPLGFGHLVDELNNALNPESGLPRNLLLRPEQMQQMGMEKAVRHVDAINKWRAAQQAAASAELANKAMVVREYAENNPKGLRWMELGPEKNIDESLIQVGRDGGAKVEVPGEEARYFDSPEEAKKYLTNRNLEKQLKYEGDTMGHCVGGYCPDVLEGRSRIFSLRDAKGEPHVTIEVRPKDDLDLEEHAEDMAYDRLGSYDHPDFEKVHSEIFNQLRSSGDFSIDQIKGKQNLAPKDEYLPFVQDFVRNSPLGGTWEDVGDLMNARLHRLEDESGIRYLTPEEYNLHRKKEGGLVSRPDYFDDLDAFLRR